jgi:hypothetical protein
MHDCLTIQSSGADRPALRIYALTLKNKFIAAFFCAVTIPQLGLGIYLVTLGGIGPGGSFLAEQLASVRDAEIQSSYPPHNPQNRIRTLDYTHFQFPVMAEKQLSSCLQSRWRPSDFACLCGTVLSRSDIPVSHSSLVIQPPTSI